MTHNQKYITLPSGEKISALCFGSWYLGEKTSCFSKEVNLVRDAVDAGCRVFDTAETYGNGGAQEVLGEALQDCRKDVFLIAKALPENAVSYDSLTEACERALERLKTDYLDMFLIHWCSDTLDLREAQEAFKDLYKQGLVRGYGIANADCDEMKEWIRVASKENYGVCQTLFNLFHRTQNRKLLKICHKGKIPVMTYFPYEAGNYVYKNNVLKEIASELDATPRQVALAWSFSHKNNAVIYKAAKKKDVLEAFDSMRLVLSERHKTLLDGIFPMLG